MKKLLITLLALAACGSSYADNILFQVSVDTITATNAIVAKGALLPLSLSSTTIQTTVPSNGAGSLVYCNSCVNGYLCISTGTAAGAFTEATSTTTHCQ